MIFSFYLVIFAISFKDISSRMVSYLWTLEPNWSDKLAAELPSWTSQALSSSHCSFMCLNQAFCMSFFFNNNTLQCQGHNVLLKDTTGSSSESGWSYYAVTCKGTGYTYVRDFDTCYKVFFDKIPWNDANNVCLNDGGHMINLADDNKYNYFVNLLKSDPVYTENYWLGLTDLAEEGKFVWTQTGSVLDNLSPWWRAGEPSTTSTRQNCVQMVNPLYGLDDYNCIWNLRYICEVAAV